MSGGGLTPEQERAVLTDGIDLVVRAGAGSGKTRVLVERAVRLVTREEDPLALSEILAITFTEKAAREMKERLAEELTARRGPAARAQVQWAYVSTIHGFCARLLRENAVEARIDPAFEVTDEVQAEAMLDDAFDDVAERFAAEESEAMEQFTRIDAAELRSPILSLYSLLRAAGESPSGMRIPEADPAAVAAAVREILSALDEIPGLLPGQTTKGAEKGRAVLEHREAIADLSPDTPFAEARARLDGLGSSIKLQVRADLKAVLRPLREEVIPGARGRYADVHARPALLALRHFLIELDGRYSRAKEEMGVLDFQDLEGRAHDLLATREDVRGTVRRRFRQILVDEVQDVNPLQNRILGLLRIEGNSFSVGDVKQSIYGFRHADPALFKQYAEEVGAEGLVTLASNFRSRPGLVAFANHCFGRLFEGHDLVDFAPMAARGDYETPEGEEEDAGDSDVEIILSPGENMGEFRELEARTLASRIREIVDSRQVRIRRVGERRGQAVSYRDIAILFRALSDVKTYERALEEHGVPFYVVKGGGFYQAREVVDLARLLRTVQNPRDEISLAATLRSPFAALSEDGLLALATARRARGRLADLLPEPDSVGGMNGADRERWLRFASLLSRLRKLAGRVSIREVMETALTESGYATALWLLPGARRHQANVDKALSLADSFEGMTDLAGFVDALEDLRGREIRETEAPTGGEAEDVVQLMTVHGAKGLEFPVVFLPDLTRTPPRAAPGLLYGESGVAVKVRSRDGPVPTAAYLSEKEARESREQSESLRLLYVAVTRAEERLVLSARDTGGKPKRGTWWEALHGALAADDGGFGYGDPPRAISVLRIGEPEDAGVRRVSLARRFQDRLARGEPIGNSRNEHVRAAREVLDRTDRALPAAVETRFQNTISELLLFDDCPLCYRDRYLLGIPAPSRRSAGGSEIEEGEGEAPADSPGADEFPATDRGIIVHDVLRAYDPEAGVPIDEIVRERIAAHSARSVDETQVARMSSLVERFYESEIGREVRAADPAKVRREVPFFVRWPVADGPDLLLRGQIDLLYPGPDGRLRVIDYKTGTSSPDRYEIQIGSYAHALARFAPEGVGSAGLVYLDREPEPGFHPVSVGEDSRRLVDRAAEAFSRTLAGETPWPAEHEGHCRRSG